jgi:putative ABC transport system permease protein
MLRNYFKIAFRNLSKNKAHTALNIVGLTLGIAICMIIFIIIQFQTSFEGFHVQKNNIYRVLTEAHHADLSTIGYKKNVPFPLPTAMKSAFPQLENVAPVYASHNDELQILDKNGMPIKSFKVQSGVFSPLSFF